MCAEQFRVTLSWSGGQDQEHRQRGMCSPTCLAGAHDPELSRTISSCTSNACPGCQSSSPDDASQRATRKGAQNNNRGPNTFQKLDFLEAVGLPLGPERRDGFRAALLCLLHSPPAPDRAPRTPFALRLRPARPSRRRSESSNCSSSTFTARTPATRGASARRPLHRHPSPRSWH